MTSSPRAVKLVALAGSTSLLTRTQGAALREQVLELLEGEPSVEIDMSGVNALSPSFADELFGGLQTSFGRATASRIRVSCARVEWRRLIRSALAHRRAIDGQLSKDGRG